ncbi:MULTISPECIES: putative quinol monooxygenase [Pseudomonas]|uniref:Antibiotic biosynthesis monooxygenase n=1 Tax=Pseudomonas saxonica TaxID=2600598 RepID=A0A5C5PWT6_9PSED|nr:MULTISPECIES: antibiotic biosynthesis monooxygenase [Pseudomonas]MCH4871538.1 antibiotic biosynthesis monooxygenase [Pseudomonas sp. TMW22091]TWR87929.1 antibiotic biosynthesis monooxygenase [Pseudomonas saxonica]TWR92774.1 antibiotic biosynthesis monooxygenase [Pseudomonas saxonica]
MPQSHCVSHTTRVHARAGCSVQVQACLMRVIEPTLKTPGCLHFALQQCDSDPLLWQIAGYWQDECAMQAYFNSSVMEVYSVLLNEQMIERLEFQTFTEEVAVPMQKHAG